MKNMMFLVIVSDMHVCPKCKASAVSRQNPVQDFKEGCLAGSVISDYRYMFASFDFKADIFKKGLGRKRFA